jgi:hypothetical protein
MTACMDCKDDYERSLVSSQQHTSEVFESGVRSAGEEATETLPEAGRILVSYEYDIKNGGSSDASMAKKSPSSSSYIPCGDLWCVV